MASISAESIHRAAVFLTQDLEDVIIGGAAGHIGLPRHLTEVPRHCVYWENPWDMRCGPCTIQIHKVQKLPTIDRTNGQGGIMCRIKVPVKDLTRLGHTLKTTLY